MRVKFSKYGFLLSLLLMISCSNEKLENLGVIKKKANQYSVSRKAPLEMPPDMYLRPPDTERKKKLTNIDLEEEQASLEDILSNKKLPNKKKINNKRNQKEDRILKKILNTKASVTLK